MAIPARGALGTTVSAAAGSVTPTWPTHATNEIGILVAECAGPELITLSDAQGFVEVADSPQQGGTSVSTGTRLAVFWNRAVSSSMAAPTIANPGDHIVARIVTVTGCITTGNPWDVTAGDVVDALDANIVIPGDTTTVAECLILLLVSNPRDASADQVTGWTNADLASLSAWTFSQSTVGNGGGFNIATGDKATAGTYGTTTATLAAAQRQGRMSIALKPPVTGTTPTVRSRIIQTRQAPVRASSW